MKFLFRALPTLLLIALAFALANAHPTPTVPSSVRLDQQHKLQQELDAIRARQRAIPPTAPFLPRAATVHPEAALPGRLAPAATSATLS